MPQYSDEDIALIQAASHPKRPKRPPGPPFDPDHPQPTVEDVRCRLRANYVITQPQVRALLDEYDRLANDLREILIRQHRKAVKEAAKAGAVPA